MELWDKFCKSGKIEDYLAYASAERNEKDDDPEGIGVKGNRQR